MVRTFAFLLPLLAFALVTPASERLPEVDREFRGVWIATVDNIDFPSKRTLSVAEQKAELIRDLDLAAELNFNAVIFQVRPMCDAIYASPIEPWSEFLTGEMGRPNGFDPLRFLVAEAHKRGIQVHAWFNPYRAWHPAARTVSENHITKRRPDLVRDYGRFKWLDPGDHEVQNYSLGVVLDVVRRYDIDGVHFDDYFYPYPITEDGRRVEFPDDATYLGYRRTAARMSTPRTRRIPLERDAWRRSNVDLFIERVGREIKRIKPEILYGISPFGVADENYKNLYADVEKWLREGTIDYFVPQLYWRIDRPNREFPKLLKYWTDRNPKGRHIWAGIGTYKLYDPKENYSSAEIAAQIGLTRTIQPTRGNIQFSFKSVRNDADGLQQRLKSESFARRAIIPQFPWIKGRAPLAPAVTVSRVGAGGLVRAKWVPRGTRKAFWYVVYVKDQNGWSHSVLPASETSIALSADRRIERIVVKAVDRVGRASR